MKININTSFMKGALAIFFTIGLIPLKAQVFEDILGHSGDYHNYRQFKSMFGRATTDVNKTIPLQLEQGALKGIYSKEEIESDAGEGAWKVILTGWRDVAAFDNEIKIEYCPSAVLNYGSRMEYVFYSPEIPSFVFESVEKECDDIKEDILTEYEDMKVNWGRDGNKILVSAVYPYTGGVDSDDIQERIVFLMNKSRDLIRKVMEVTVDEEDDYLDQMKDNTYSYMSKNEFEGLVSGMDFTRFADQTPRAKEGSYAFTTAGTRNLEFFNHGSKLEFTYWEKIAYGISDTRKQVVLDQISSWVNDNPMDNAEMIVHWYPDYEENIQVKAAYNLTGQLEGSELHDMLNEFISDWTESLYEEIRSIMEDYTQELKERELSYLEKGVFLLLINNDIFSSEGTAEEVNEGYWEFHVDNTYQYQIYNYGNNLWMTSWYKLPESLSQEAINEIISYTQQFANENSFSDKFQYIVRNYPGADKEYIQLVASLEFPEPVAGGVIAEGYNSFVYDLAQETYSHLEDLVDNY